MLGGARPLQRSLLGADRRIAWRATVTGNSKWGHIALNVMQCMQRAFADRLSSSTYQFCSSSSSRTACLHMHEQHSSNCQQHLHLRATAPVYHTQHIITPTSRVADPVAGVLLCAMWCDVAAATFVIVVAVASVLAVCVVCACRPPCRPCFTSFC